MSSHSDTTQLTKSSAIGRVAASCDIQDRKYMSRAIQLAKRGEFTVFANPLVGCVIVKDNVVLSEGWHKKAGQAHAEVDALQHIQGNDSQANKITQGATAYVSLEPCCHTGKTGPCAHALIEAGIKRVVCATRDPAPHVAGGGIKALEAAGVEVLVGILEQEAKALNLGFFKRMQTGLPYVRLKMAMSIDGKTALNNGQSQWITGEAARRDVHVWRAKSHAIVTGVDTVLADDPLMNARLNDNELAFGEIDQPLRVVIDSQHRINAEARIFSNDGKCKVAGFSEVSDWKLAKDNQNKVSLTALLEKLAKEQVNEVWVEAGTSLAGAFVEQSLVDELMIYMAPIILGNNAKALFDLPELTSMDAKKTLRLLETRKVGEDTRMTFSFNELTK